MAGLVLLILLVVMALIGLLFLLLCIKAIRSKKRIRVVVFAVLTAFILYGTINGSVRFAYGVPSHHGIYEQEAVELYNEIKDDLHVLCNGSFAEGRYMLNGDPLNWSYDEMPGDLTEQQWLEVWPELFDFEIPHPEKLAVRNIMSNVNEPFTGFFITASPGIFMGTPGYTFGMQLYYKDQLGMANMGIYYFEDETKTNWFMTDLHNGFYIDWGLEPAI